MKHLGLFEGIGGFSLAAKWMGWETVAWCEWNEFGQKILKYHFPNAEGHGDITKTDFKKYANKIDIVTGGFPCQPYSNAGKRKGKEDDRHLWPEMLRAIREIQPSYVVGENVRGLTNWNGGMVFDEVQADLEAEGYEVLPFLLPACAVNAPHRRDRIWFVAYSSNNGFYGTKNRQGDIKGNDDHKAREAHIIESSGCCDSATGNNVTDSKSESSRRKHEQRHEKGEFGGYNSKNDVTNSQCDRRRKVLQNIQSEKPNGKRFNAFNEPNNWKEFPTEAPICDGDDGLSSRLDAITFPKWRTESVKGGGNAIVPQVAYQIFKVIDKMAAPEQP